MKKAKKNLTQKFYKLLETLALINTTQDIDKLLETILKAGKWVVEADACSIMLLDPDQNELYFNTIEGGSAIVKKIRIPVKKGIAGHVMQTGRPIVVHDVEKSNFFLKSVDEQTKFKTKSMICIPLKNRKKTIGVLQALNKRNGKFTDQDKELFVAFGHQVAVAIDNARLYNLAFYDSLTHVFVRRYFEAWLSQEFSRVKRYKTNISIIMFDIDYFKRINDRYGHPGGDAVLQGVAKTVKNNIRRADIISRYGGEEFVVCLPETKMQKAKISAERIRSAIEKQVFLYNGHKIRVTISLGVASFRNTPEDTVAQFIKDADQALYESKQKGRNRVTVYRSIIKKAA